MTDSNPAAIGSDTPDQVAIDHAAWDGLVLCATCGVEQEGALAAAGPAALTDARDDARSDVVPAVCAICADDRQWVPADGQRWTTVGELRASGTNTDMTELEPNLWAVRVSGGVGIGQHAKVLVTEAGNLMVDVPAYIDRAAVDAVLGLGGLAGIIASHPHMYGAQSAWAEACGGVGGPVPVYVSEADAGWLARRPANTVVWSGSLTPLAGPAEPTRPAGLPGSPVVTASQPGGHFPGSVVVHFTGQDGAGVLLAGDTVGVARDRKGATFMRSFPNYLPLSGAVAQRIAGHLDRYDYERLYDNFSGAIASEAAAVVHRSARRHADWAEGRMDHLT
ncbi:hydrolase [Citricoccus sp.]|uniref:hydrolase n=1 Tax=Citricoccus sp. TaxID=1978372 RepID=UPI0028BDD523|nr:hydrolase [Citricoccus sp.]